MDHLPLKTGRREAQGDSMLGRREMTRNVRRLGAALLMACLPILARVALADGVSGSSGGYLQAIPIAVPTYRGLEPRLVLGYSSRGRGGFAGVGWGLSGFATVERVGAGLGAPRYNSTDVYLLGGMELLPCPAPNSSPSCTNGGTHTTKAESNLKVRFDAGPNTWTVWGKSGTRTVFSAVYSTPSGTLWWGQTSVIDTHNNTVTYAWTCPQDEDCYLDSVQFGPYSVKVYRETRPDVMSLATGHSGTLRQIRSRLKSVLVKYGASTVRA
jgi:Salmonella virulence plasmid 65kDa B protein